MSEQVTREDLVHVYRIMQKMFEVDLSLFRATLAARHGDAAELSKAFADIEARLNSVVELFGQVADDGAPTKP